MFSLLGSRNCRYAHVFIVVEISSLFVLKYGPYDDVFTFYQISNGMTGFIVSDNVPLFVKRSTPQTTLSLAVTDSRTYISKVVS